MRSRMPAVPCVVDNVRVLIDAVNASQTLTRALWSSSSCINMQIKEGKRVVRRCFGRRLGGFSGWSRHGGFLRCLQD